MSSIVVSGDTSGAITIAAPAVAGTNTLTLPANTGTVLTTASTAVVTQAMLSTNVAGNGPAFSAYLPTTNQSVTSNTWTKVNLSAETFDTNSNFDSTTNYRFTPTVAGYYHINGAVYSNSNATSTQVACAIYKNGSSYKVASISGSFGQGGAYVTDIVYFNGSTDYVELYGLNVSSNSPVFQQGANYTYFSGALIRAA